MPVDCGVRNKGFLFLLFWLVSSQGRESASGALLQFRQKRIAVCIMIACKMQLAALHSAKHHILLEADTCLPVVFNHPAGHRQRKARPARLSRPRTVSLASSNQALEELCSLKRLLHICQAVVHFLYGSAVALIFVLN